MNYVVDLFCVTLSILYGRVNRFKFILICDLIISTMNFSPEGGDLSWEQEKTYVSKVS